MFDKKKLGFLGFLHYMHEQDKKREQEELQKIIEELDYTNCEGCGRRVRIDDKQQYGGLGGTYCPECYSKYIVKCSVCGHIMHKDEAKTDKYGNYYCSRFCYEDNVQQCIYCGGGFRRSIEAYSYNEPICPTCGEERGLIKCDRCEDYFEEKEIISRDFKNFCDLCYEIEYVYEDVHIHECLDCERIFDMRDLTDYRGITGICPDCMENYQYCDSCGSLEKKSDLIQRDGEWICQFCATHSVCRKCGETFANEDMVIDNNTAVCKNCFGKEYVRCAGCGKITNIEDTDTYEGKVYCDNCHFDLMNEFYGECNECGEPVRKEEAVQDDYYFLCEDCYKEHYTRCSFCDMILRNDELFYYEDKVCCEDCLEEQKEKKLMETCDCCEDCGEYVPKGTLTATWNWNVCKKCLEKNYTRCEGCGKFFENSDISRFNEKSYCEFCYEEKMDEISAYCDYCGERFLFEKLAVNDGYNAICPECLKNECEICCECGYVIDKGDAVYDEEGKPYCEDCYDDKFEE